ncbi:MAG: tetratricopeptide repeat protein, partial [bacterium]|nr:tetratricopeptide repeat protein [bacterium]
NTEDEAIGSLIGPYRIEKVIGSGGMGVVYLASRADDEYERQVAIKLLHTGQPQDELVRRFRNERQILAALEHPNIAGLLDGGTAPDGRPYLVMEYVEGLPVDRYCDKHQLSLRERLVLFRKICAAVAFAHRSLIVHRDLKPSNILVSDEGEPKLLDFGIAKLLDPAAISDGGETTRTGMRIMSPNFASPEQIRSRPITTASDVYSLGVVLYQLLTGDLPRRFEDFSLAAIEREFEREPTAPSSALTECSDAPRLRRQLAGDVDAIVLKALREEPSQRYGSVEHLAADLRRHLDGLPVRARRGTFAYRAGKLLRRRKFGLAVTALVVGLAVSFTLSTVAQQRRTVHERDRAERIAEFMVSIFEQSSPQSGDSNVSIREVLESGAERIEEEFAEFPNTQADLFHTVGLVYEELCMYRDALPLLRKEVALRESLSATHSPELSQALNTLSNALIELGEREEAKGLLERAIVLSEGKSDEHRAEFIYSLRLLGRYYSWNSEPESAAANFRRALEVSELALGPDAPEVAEVLIETGSAQSALGEYQEAEKNLLRAIEILENETEQHQPTLSAAIGDLGLLYFEMGKLAKAAENFQRSIEIYERIGDMNDPGIGVVLNNLALVQANRGKIEESNALYRRSLEVKLRGYEETSPTVLATRHNLAFGLYDLGELEEAREQWQAVLAGCRQVLAPDSSRTATVLKSLAQVNHFLGHDRIAQQEISESNEILEMALDDDHRVVLSGLSTEAQIRYGNGDLSGAERLLREATSRWIDQPDAEPGMWHAGSTGRLAEILISTGRFDEATERLDLADEITEALMEKEPSASLNGISARLHIARGDLFRAQEDPALAQAAWEHALYLLEENPPGSRGFHHQLLSIAVLLRLDRPEEARADAEHLIALGWKRPEWLQLALGPETKPEDVPVLLY